VVVQLCISGDGSASETSHNYKNIWQVKNPDKGKGPTFLLSLAERGHNDRGEKGRNAR